MVSPLNKSDHNILAGFSRASVSSESPAVTYISPGSFSEPQADAYENRYISRREPERDRWSTENITPPRVIAETSLAIPFEQSFFTPLLSKGLVQSQYVPLAPGEPAGFYNLDVADLASSPTSYQEVTPPIEGQPYGEAAGSFVFQSRGVSTDLSHVVYQQNGHVYEWAAGKLDQVDITPTGTQFQYGAEVGSPVNPLYQAADASHAVSASGLRVFFTEGEAGNKNVGQLYVRENPEQEPSLLGPKGECTEPAKACTVEVSASQKTNGTGPGGTDLNGYGQEGHPRPARYWDASNEGERVFFTSRAELTNEANTGPKDNAANLYEYNLETKELTDLAVPTEAEKAEDPDGAAVLGLVNASEDGSYVYFVAEGKLAEGATSGRPNLYLYQQGESQPKFIATLAPATTAEAEANEGGTPAEEGGDSADWAGTREANSDTHIQGPATHTARVTPDGMTLAFESELSLTGYDNEQAEQGECSEGRCREVYLYSVGSGSHPPTLVCVSCDPSGVLPVGPAELGGHEQGGAEGLIGINSYYLPRNLSEDGKRLFFQSPDPLVSYDSNGKRDVYEWEAAGEGSCTQAEGCVFPISDVAGDYESSFMDASTNGDDVFIATADQLLPSDTDTRVDIYDVRVGGGFPVTVAAPVCDNGDSCKPPISPQPSIFGAPSSATFSGPGNPVPAVSATPLKKATTKTVKCKKGFAKKKGKCVKSKKKSKKAKKAKKSTRRAH